MWERVTGVYTAGFIIHFELDPPFLVFLLPCSLVLIWSFSFTKEKDFCLVLAIFNCEYGDFSILVRVIIVLLLSYFGLQQRWWQVEGWYWNIWEWRLGVTWNRTYVGSTNWGIFTAPRTTFPTRWHNTPSHMIRYGHDLLLSLCILCILHSQPVGLVCTTDTSHWVIFENHKKICPSVWQVQGWDWNISYIEIHYVRAFVWHDSSAF